MLDFCEGSFICMLAFKWFLRLAMELGREDLGERREADETTAGAWRREK